MTLWHGRLGGGTADVVMDYSSSLHYDRRLALDDLAGSRAHVRGLGRGGLLDRRTRWPTLLAALDQVEGELAAGAFAFAPDDEDIHTAVERRVTEIAGDAGAKLHTGRSRNDQIATDLRLYAKRELARRGGRRSSPSRTSCWTGPGRPATSTSPATPTCSGPSRCSWPTTCWPTGGRCPATWTGCWPRSTGSTSPRWGPGRWPARPCPSIPTAWPHDLGFAGRFENSLDAVSDRDFVAEALFDLALLGVHLSRIGEELVLWTTEEFGFAVLDDAFATGSSMLPQKKNPDVAELARGKTGRLIGNLTGLLVTLKGLPLAYNRDLQEDKEPLFDSVDQTRLALAALTGLLATVRFDAARMQAAADGPAAAAVDLAEWLVEQGMPVPPGPRRGGGTGPRLHRAAACPWPSWSPPIRPWAPRRLRCSSRGWRSPGAPRREGPDPRRSQVQLERFVRSADWQTDSGPAPGDAVSRGGARGGPSGDGRAWASGRLAPGRARASTAPVGG